MLQRECLAPGVHLNCIPADKFNRCRISLHFRFPASREKATDQALLPLVMDRGYAACPDMTQLSRKLARLYGAALSVETSMQGASRVLSVSITGIKDQFVAEAEELVEAAKKAKERAAAKAAAEAAGETEEAPKKVTKKATTAKKTTAKKPAAKKQVPWMTKTTNRFKKLKDEDVQALTKAQQAQYAKALEKYEAEKAAEKAKKAKTTTRKSAKEAADA